MGTRSDGVCKRNRNYIITVIIVIVVVVIVFVVVVVFIFFCNLLLPVPETVCQALGFAATYGYL